VAGERANEFPHDQSPLGSSPREPSATATLTVAEQATANHSAVSSVRQTAPAESRQAKAIAVPVAVGVRANLAERRVELDTEVCLEAGWLEQVACSPGTREHESLVVVKARPRDVHAALLLLGLEPGEPGSWRVEDGNLVAVPPTGPRLRVKFRWVDTEGRTREHSPAEWIRDVRSAASPPIDHWLFAGSLLQPLVDGSSRYAADGSGSVVGLVTFGDEVVALPEVRPDSESILEPEWEAWTERLPAIGTPVVMILEAMDAAGAAP